MQPTFVSPEAVRRTAHSSGVLKRPALVAVRCQKAPARAAAIAQQVGDTNSELGARGHNYPCTAAHKPVGVLCVNTHGSCRDGPGARATKTL